jgi:hypothetical protein
VSIPERLSADTRVVTPAHIAVMRIMGDVVRAYGPTEFRLEGGTALSAYYLHHRESEDLDFFAGLPVEMRAFVPFMHERLTSAGLVSEAPRAPNASFGELLVRNPAVPNGPAVKVQFACTSPYRLGALVETTEGILVASYRDLCRGKLEAVCGRTEFRDFVDLHVILRSTGVGECSATDVESRCRFRALVADLKECDPGMTTVYIAQAIAGGKGRRHVSSLPLRLLVPLTDDAVEATIALCVDEAAALIREELDIHAG